MPNDLDFDADEFQRLPVTERARRCRLLAQRARALAQGSPAHRDAYEEIAKQWLKLADDMELSASMENSK